MNESYRSVRTILIQYSEISHIQNIFLNTTAAALAAVVVYLLRTNLLDMANAKGVEGLKGTWDYVNDENMDAFMKEMGVGMGMRMMAKGVKPRLVISENGGKWTIRSESSHKTTSIEFTPDVEFDDTTADGREVKTIVRFKDGKLEHTTRDKSGKEWVATRYINDQGQQQLDMKCGSVKAHRLFKRVE